MTSLGPQSTLGGPTGLGTSAARLSPETPTAGGTDHQQPLRIPQLVFPWPPACHPDAEDADQEMLAFGDRFDLFPTPAARSHAERARYGWLAARSYPNADREFLQITADYFLTTFLIDDLFIDQSETLTDHTTSDLTAIIDVLDHHRPRTEPVFGEYAWHNVCSRLRVRLSDEHYQRFANGNRMWAMAAGLLILDRQNRSPVSVESYETIRRYTGAAYPSIDLTDATGTGAITAEEFNHPVTQRLRLHANNVIAWSNDVHSAHKETHEPGQPYNLVLLYHRDGLPLQQSLDLVVSRVHAEITQFQDLATMTEDHCGPRLRGLIAGMRHWMRGYQDWVDNDTRRYLSHP
ncbi:hypothetical protein [Nocardia sp. NPDC052316]|uniref:terpene synthase family protein n=1 Tax=Nocardia sp. NPDC052316 TaxID=3364329 RepID=UPI0037CAC757